MEEKPPPDYHEVRLPISALVYRFIWLTVIPLSVLFWPRLRLEMPENAGAVRTNGCLYFTKFYCCVPPDQAGGAQVQRATFERKSARKSSIAPI